jgi:hypothetical protein
MSRIKGNDLRIISTGTVARTKDGPLLMGDMAMIFLLFRGTILSFTPSSFS